MGTAKETLKQLLRRLHKGEDPERLKGEFREILDQVGPDLIGQVEQELVKEGIPLEEIRRLCDVHLRLLRDAIEKGTVELPLWHPVSTFMHEHRHILEHVEELRSAVRKLKDAGDFVPEAVEQVREIARFLMETESHYLREENALFPTMEKHGITEPPKVMWAEHQEIRPRKRELSELAGEAGSMDFDEFTARIEELAGFLQGFLSSHYYKEDNILYPMALKALSEEEWVQVRRDGDEIGYCCVTPPPIPEEVSTRGEGKPAAEGEIDLGTGSLTPEQIAAIFRSLPVDVTFVDEQDRVRFYSDNPHRVFVRTKAVLGRTVQNCHPAESVHIVNRILDAFRRGERDKAEFWITLEGRLVYIRYFPVRDPQGRYLGTLEVTQDITDIKGITGEKKLLDWGG